MSLKTTKTTTALLTLVVVASFAGTMISVPQMIGSASGQSQACPDGSRPVQGQCIVKTSTPATCTPPAVLDKTTGDCVTTTSVPACTSPAVYNPDFQGHGPSCVTTTTSAPIQTCDPSSLNDHHTTPPTPTPAVLSGTTCTVTFKDSSAANKAECATVQGSTFNEPAHTCSYASTPTCTPPAVLSADKTQCILTTFTPATCTSPAVLDVATGNCVTTTKVPACESPAVYDPSTQKCVTTTTTKPGIGNR